MGTASAATGAGRTMQKERTRQALLSAARELIAEGRPPSVAEAAKRASISEATAYRYYSSTRSLLGDALVARWPNLETVLAHVRAAPTAEARARVAAEAMARNVLDQEPHIRALIALSYSSRVGDDAGDLRPAYRMSLIKAVMEALPPRFAASRRHRLKLALSTIISAEAVFSLKDAQECSARDIVSTMGWLAYHVVTASLGEASPRSAMT